MLYDKPEFGSIAKGGRDRASLVKLWVGGERFIGKTRPYRWGLTFEAIAEIVAIHLTQGRDGVSLKLHQPHAA
jgi:hypothetical protein